jgi:hypothetical protein
LDLAIQAEQAGGLDLAIQAEQAGGLDLAIQAERRVAWIWQSKPSKQ